MRNLKKGFTLVELIVVITILAILGTIGFISLQGYSSDARNSKRTSDLGSIATAISSKVTGGMTLLSLLTGVNGNQLTSPIIAGSGVTVASGNYNAGTVNYTALGIKQADFIDPDGNHLYIMGATSKLNGKYQLAASMEQGGGTYVAKVTGDYTPRTSVSAITVATYGNGSGTLLISSPSNVGLLVSGDTISGTGIPTGTTIAKVSPDGLTLTLSANATAAGSSIQLASAETGGLIDANNASNNTGVVIDALSTALPY